MDFLDWIGALFGSFIFSAIGLCPGMHDDDDEPERCPATGWVITNTDEDGNEYTMKDGPGGTK